jgi:hypothetical protein
MRGLQFSADAHDAWTEYCRLLQTAILHEDPSFFLRWKFVRRAMCLTNHVFLKNELLHLERLPDWQSRWYPALQDPRVGNPIPYLRKAATVGNSVHLAYHIAQWESWSGRNIAELETIVEFGGGFGAMARLVRALGFAGRYIIYDLPQFGALQRFYLRCCGLDERTETVADFASLQAALPAQRSGERLFLANISLSETPLEVRRPFERLIRDMEHVLITYQPRFHGVDNVAYFNGWRSADRIWGQQEVPNFPGGCWYLFGRLAAAQPVARVADV